MPNKSFYRLDEIAERWLVTEDDLLVYALDGRLELSAFMLGREVAFGTVIDGESIVRDQRKVFGTLPLYAEDLGGVFKSGSGSIGRFKATEPDAFIQPVAAQDRVVFFIEDVVVTFAERQRFEREHGIADEAQSEAAKPAVVSVFVHNDDYSIVSLGPLMFGLGQKQAAIVRALHLASLNDKPWVRVKDLMEAAGSDSAYPGEVMKSQKNWRQLIETNGQGAYRLRLTMASSKARRAFRHGVSGLFTGSTLH